MRTWASTLLGWWGERLLEIPCGAVEFPEQVPGFVQWELVTWDKLPSSINLYRGQCPPPCRGAIWWRAWYSACHLLTVEEIPVVWTSWWERSTLVLRKLVSQGVERRCAESAAPTAVSSSAPFPASALADQPPGEGAQLEGAGRTSARRSHLGTWGWSGLWLPLGKSHFSSQLPPVTRQLGTLMF